MNLRRLFSQAVLDAAALLVIGPIFIIPFIFMLLTASKTRQEASQLEFSLPETPQLIQNIREVIQFADYRVVLATRNSVVLTIGSVILIVLLGSMAAFVMQRRGDRGSSIAATIMLAGLIIPPSVVPTIFVLQAVELFRTIFGMILVEVALSLPFATLIFRTFMSTIPRELDEAAIMDGASPLRVYLTVILPLLWPAIVTVIVVSSVTIYNDFVGPLYFLPGSENVTVQLTLYSFISQFSNQWNLLFADVILITIVPLVMFMFFQRQIVSGMTTGAVRG